MSALTVEFFIVMKKISLNVDELNMILAYRNSQAQKGAENAISNNSANQAIEQPKQGAEEKPRRKYQMQPVYRVIKKARRWFLKQLKKDTQAKVDCLKAALADSVEIYPDALRFDVDYRTERERLTDSKRFCDTCKALGLVPAYVADHIVFEGKGTLEKVLKDGLQVLGDNVKMFNAQIWEDRENLFQNATNHQVETKSEEVVNE